MLPFEGLAQIDPLNIGIASKRFRRTCPEDLSVVDNVCSVGNCKRLTHVVIRYEDPDTATL